jgi:hypothetical protein
MATELMTQEEIQGLARKLEELSATLPPGEEALLRAILTRAGAEEDDDVEAHRLARTSIAALVLAAAGTVGVANANPDPVHHAVPAAAQVHHVVSVVDQDKGGAETIVYTTRGPSGSR